MYLIEPMTQDDVEEVSRLERRCFSNPWPLAAYRRELRAPQQNYYSVLREWPDEFDAPDHASVNGDPGAAEWSDRLRQRLATWTAGRLAGQPRGKPPILGFGGMWKLYEEAHITTIGVEPDYRGRGLGDILLMDMFEEALRRGATWVTLEVRVSNTTAQNLYRKFGFSIQGRRPRYYSDNNEDAFIMWSESLKEPAVQDQLAKLKRAIERRARFAGEVSPSR